MKLTPVQTKADWRDFHALPHLIYKDDPNWIAPLQGDVASVFDPKMNDAFKDGEAICFLLRGEQGDLLGRIAAFIDHARNRSLPHPIGGLGFFECLEDERYAFALFEGAAAWLRERGVALVDGPINFGEREKFWGLLVKGFHPPLFQENYHPHYYRAFFEAWGFVPFEQILTFKGYTRDIPVERLTKVLERMKRNFDIETQVLDYSRLPKYTQDFCEIYNAAFRKYGHFKPLVPEQVTKILMEAKPIADPNIMSITYFNGRPAAFCALLPDINALLKPVRGKLSWWKLPAFLWHRFRTKTYDAKGIGFGVHPEYQSKGGYAAIMVGMSTERNMRRYPYMYLTTVRAHNHDAVSVYSKLSVEVDRIHVAYRKALVPGAAIEPFPFTEEW